MTISKNGKGYRIRYMIDGKQKSIQVDHKPTIKEAEQLINIKKAEAENQSEHNDTFEALANECIESKRNVLSPNTIRGYKVCLSRISDNFKKTKINAIDELLIQREVNRISADTSPKTTRNTFSFISSVIKMYRPNMILRIKLPQKKPKEMYCPTDEDIKRILEAAKPTKYYVAYCLGVMGMRRGEIAALKLSDLDGNILTISKSTYDDGTGKRGIKDTAKNESSHRKLYLSDELVERINKQGYIYRGAESRLWASLSDYQELLGIPHFRFHDLRVYFATYAHLMGIPDKVIQDTGGWKSDFTMKKIYRKEQEEKNLEAQANYLKSIGI